jgi:hypothetical protein
MFRGTGIARMHCIGRPLPGSRTYGRCACPLYRPQFLGHRIEAYAA